MVEISRKNDQPRDINEEMKRAFIDYSMSVIMSRALPDIRDGLKPVHRRILYAMNDMGLTYNKPYKKSARVVGECFVEHTMILTEKGLTDIKHVKRGDSVYTQSGIEKVKELYIMPKKELVKVTLENGLENKVTKSQKFKVLTNDLTFEWKEAKELTPQDFVVIKYDYPKIQNRIKLKKLKNYSLYLNEDIAYLLGVFLADGWISEDYGRKKHPRICFYGGTNKEIAEKVVELLKKEFRYTPTIEEKTYQTKTKEKRRIYSVRINRKEINDFFVSNFHLQNVNALTKKIPHQIFTSPRKVVYSFISGLIDGDGSIHKQRNTIHYGSISEEMINQLMLLLQHHGIFSSKHSSTGKKTQYIQDRKITEHHMFFYLEIHGSNAVALAKQLTVITPEKNRVLQRIAHEDVRKRDAWSKYDIIPYSGERIFGDLSKRHLGGGWYEDTTGEKFREGITYPAGCKIRYAKDLKTKHLHLTQILQWGIHEKLQRIGSNINEFINYVLKEKLRFIRVRSVEPIDEQVTYDIEVENNHEFIANGMVSHNCLGKYHPHGDQAVYDSMVRMAQNFSLRYPLIDGQGNWGSIDGDSAAALRYTETRMAKIANLMLQDIEKDTVEWRDNFDGSLKEPEVLPAVLPNLLINGASGIAVGMATNMAPHNLSEVIDGIIRMIDTPEISTTELMDIIKGPDFPTGGIIYGRGGILSAYTTGRGSLIVRAKTSIEEGEQRNRIIVHELPYQVNKSVLLQTIAELVKEKKIEGISDLRDESDRKGMRVVIELKRDAIDDVVMNQLFEHTELQSSFGVLNLAIVKGEPKVLTLKEILHHYIEFRIEVIIRRTTYDLNKAKEKMHILEGLMIALRNIDEVIKIIRQSKEVDEAKSRLMKRFALSEIQAKAILDMRLQKLTGMEIDAVEKEYKETKELIERLEALLADKQKILDEIKRELLDIKDRFGDGRRTQIVEGEVGIDIEDLIPQQEVVVTITKDGYIKRIPTETYRTQHRGGKGLIGVRPKEEDYVVDTFITSTHDYLMFFTNHGRAYWLKGYKIPEGDRYAKGKAIINLLPRLGEGEKIETAVPVHEFDEKHYLIFATKKGTIKKTVLSAYSNIRVNGIIAIKLEEGDELMGVQLSDGTQTVMIATAGGQACRFNEKELRPMGRATRGVIGIRMKNKNDSVVALTVVDITGSLLTITENGFGKRSPIDEYRMTHRGSKGVRTIVTNERNGTVVFVSQVTDDNELIITTEHGMTVRIPVRDIREQGRNTMGVRIMRLNEGDKVVSVTQVLAEPFKEEGSAESIESMPLGIIEEQPLVEEQATQPVVERRKPVIKEEPSPKPREPADLTEEITPVKKAKKIVKSKKPMVQQAKKKQKIKTIRIKTPKKPKKKRVKTKKIKVLKAKKSKKPSIKLLKVKKARKKPAKPKKAKKKSVKKPKPTKKLKRKK
jgi:DNA gyrase subunit A